MRSGSSGSGTGFDDHIGEAAVADDDGAPTRFGDSCDRSASCIRSDPELPVAELECSLERRLTEQPADAVASTIGGNGDEHLPGAVDAGEADQPPTLDDPQAKPGAESEQLNQRWERLRIGTGGRAEVPRL